MIIYIYPAISSYLLVSHLFPRDPLGISPSINLDIYISMASFSSPPLLQPHIHPFHLLLPPSLLPCSDTPIHSVLSSSPEETLIKPVLDTIFLSPSPLSEIYISHTASPSAMCLPISRSSPYISSACISALEIGYFSHLRNGARLLSVQVKSSETRRSACTPEVAVSARFVFWMRARRAGF